MSYSLERPVQLGLCCMNVTLKKQKPPVYAARRIIVRMINKLGIEELKRRILLNLDDLYKMLQWNEAKGIRVFRLSSEMFQHKNNKRVQDYTYDFAIPMLQKIGAYAREKGHRLTFHPGQFNNLGSNRECVIQQTLLDLEYHADVLDLMGMGADSVMVIHGGGTYGDKPGTMKRWIANYNKLPDKIKRRLVLENCEKCYSIRDCLKMSFKCGVPVVLDTHHFECYKKLHPDESFKAPEAYIPFILDTWSDKGIKPKFHVSEQGFGKIGHHSDYIEILPDYLLNIPQKYGVHIDIMIEAKMKELSIQQLYEKYPQCNCLKNNPYYICKDIMESMIGQLCLEPTSESQGHGKAYEREIQRNVFGMTEEQINSYNHTSKYDINKEDNPITGRNVSIKTSSSRYIDMSSMRNLFNSELLDVICIIYKQMGGIKESMETLVFSFDEFKEILIEDLKKCNYTLEEWLKQIDEYDNYVRSLPKPEYYLNTKSIPRKEKEHLIKKKPLCEGLKYFNIGPKIDRKQQRVQCNINLDKIDNLTIQKFEGGELFGKQYCKRVKSGRRDRHSKTT